MKGPEWDVVVAGGGPGGAAAALVLARAGRRVLLANSSGPAPSIGEALPPAARPLLRDLWLLPRILQDGHRTCTGNASAWGSPDLRVSDFIFNLHGSGLHLDRRTFDESLRSAAAAAGATVVSGWLDCRNGTTLRSGRRDVRVNQRWLVDATGRPAVAARARGARRLVEDRLFCLHARLRPAAHASDRDSRTVIESCENGWWYTAGLPCGARLLAFFTDRDLTSGPRMRSAAELMRRARQTVHVREIVERHDYAVLGPVRGTDAASSRLVAFAGPGWVAVGDAALGFDPLSSQGLFNALYTGLRAGEALDAALSGDNGPLVRYAERLERIHRAYRANLSSFYGLERRWAGHVFWTRRRDWRDAS